MTDAPRVVPAAGRAAFTRLYDPVMALTMRETRWRGRLLTRVGTAAPVGGHVIDVGAGTGTFAIALASEREDLVVSAVDADPDVLEMAVGKPGADRLRLHGARVDRLPFADCSADAVVMSLVLHHLAADAKRAALVEVWRVLRPDGRLHVVDWGRPQARTAPGFLLLQGIDGRAGTRDHAAGRLPAMLDNAGFAPIYRHRRVLTVWGTLEHLETTRRL